LAKVNNSVTVETGFLYVKRFHFFIIAEPVTLQVLLRWSQQSRELGLAQSHGQLPDHPSYCLNPEVTLCSSPIPEYERVEMSVREWLRIPELDFYRDDVFKLMSRWDKCINVSGIILKMVTLQ
jgi:hypothetical protein